MNKIKIILALVFFLKFGYAYSQKKHIKNVRQSKSKIEFIYLDSTQSNEIYKKIHCGKDSSYYIYEDQKIYINPFANNNQIDSLIDKQILNFIKSNYDFENAKKRLAFGSPLETINIVLIVDTNGLIRNFGIYLGSNVIQFENEIYQILEKMNDSRIVLPILKNKNQSYQYLKSFHFTNSDLY
jgi:hypothetical protein